MSNKTPMLLKRQCKVYFRVRLTIPDREKEAARFETLEAAAQFARDNWTDRRGRMRRAWVDMHMDFVGVQANPKSSTRGEGPTTKWLSTWEISTVDAIACNSQRQLTKPAYEAAGGTKVDEL